MSNVMELTVDSRAVPQLAQHFKNLNVEEITYLSSYGNCGDSVIDVANRRFFQQLSIRVVDFISVSTGGDVLVIGGGGSHTLEGENYQNHRIQEAVSSGFEQVVVMPISIFSLPDWIAALGPNDVVFCREEKTLINLTSKSRARLVLEHDIAFAVEYETFREIPSDYRYLDLVPRASQGRKKRRLLSFRDDEDSARNFPTTSTSLDIYPFLDPEFFGIATQTKANELAAGALVLTAYGYREIWTDRLHLAIIGAKFKKKVRLFETRSGKNSAVFGHSLKSFSNVSFHYYPLDRKSTWSRVIRAFSLGFTKEP